MRRAMVVTATAVLVAVAAIGAWLGWALTREGPDHAVEVEVLAGTPTVRVLDELAARGLLPSPLAGRLYLEVLGAGRTPRWGRYLIPARSRPVDVLERLLDGRVESTEVTVVEGLRAAEIAETLAAAGIGTLAEWHALIASGDWIHDLAPAASSLEGFLFPDTYRFAVGTDATTAARHMVTRFRQVWRASSGAVADPWGTPLEVVTLASLVEAETSVPSERARIAGVFRNRLSRGMLLQCDPTVVFALERQGRWSGRLLREHWQLDDPYNTYLHPGLPPGPINSPGRAAIEAALEPEAHGYLYFVAKPGGGHTFSRTLHEHNRAVARLKRARR